MHTSELKTQFFRRPNVPQRAAAEAATPAQVHSLADAPTELWFPAATTQPQALPTGRRQRPLLKYIFLGFVLLALLTVGFITLAGAGLIYMSDLVLPGVQVMGVDVGRLTQAEAAAALQNNSSQQTLRLTYQDTFWLVSPAELGLTLDAAATAKSAHAYGRTPEAWLEFIQTGAMAVEPSWVLDTVAAQAYLQNRAAELAVAPVNAGLLIENGQVRTTPPADGRSLDVAATVATLAQSSTTAAQIGEIPLVMQPVAPAITDVSGFVAQAETLLSTTITINATDPVRDEAVSWVVGPQVWGNWLTLAVDPNIPTQFNWTIDPDKADQFFADRNAALGENRYLDDELTLTAVTEAIKNQQENISLRIYHSPSQYVVQPGDTFAGIGRKVGIPYPWIQAANPGIGDALTVGQSITIPSPDALLPYPVIDGKRVVVSISQQRAWVYENGALKWEWPASTGIASSPTAPGVFQIQTHERNAYAANWDLWMPNFMGIYQPAPNVEFMNGFHGFPTRDGANLLWTNNLGTPVTYGCILLSNENAAQLYEWAEQGVIVEILP